MRLKWENQSETYLSIELDDGTTHTVPASSLNDPHWQEIAQAVEAGTLVIEPYEPPQA